MSRISKALGLGLLLWAVLAAPAGSELENLIAEGYSALDRWHFAEAEELAAQVQDLIPPDADPDQAASAHYFLAQYWFNRADYSRALYELNESEKLSAERSDKFEKFYGRVRHLSELFADSHSQSSEHFTMRWVDPRDELLATPGLKALEASYEALAKDFNYDPGGDKILVEIMPEPENLAQAVGLETEMIKESGTVAICKFRRLMLTSPRALAFGYDYQTTLSHELSHFFIFSVAGESVPIWLHEGIAKYEESSYEQAAGKMDPVPKSLLVSAIKNNELITFAQMYPTFAQFKTPKQGQLAFAEVATFVGLLKRKCGQDSWFKLFKLYDQGANDSTAIGSVCKTSFPAMWQDWKNWVLAQNWQVLPGAVVMKLEFKDQSGKEDEEDLEETETPGKGSEYTRLGDLLRDRGAYRAAVVEYNKAAGYEPYSPGVLNKLGLGQMLAKDYPSAIATLNRSAEIYPDYSTTYWRLGRAYMDAGDDRHAITAFETAIRLNPYNPQPYARLEKLYAKAGNQTRAVEMSKALEILTRKNE